MKLTSFLKAENIRCDLEAGSKKRALELVGKLIAESINADIQLDQLWQEKRSEECALLCPVECFASLFKREKLGCTALNYGVALPHAKLPPEAPVKISEPIAVFLKLPTPIDYEAGDHKEVDLIFAMMFPADGCEKFKDYLLAAAKRLSDKAFVKQLRAAETAEELWQLLDSDDQTETQSE